MEIEYNEVYGFMPDDIINHLSEADRKRMFALWVLRKPTRVNKIITNAVLAWLGEEFLEFLFTTVQESLEADEEEVTIESLSEGVGNLIQIFETDVNILATYVGYYLESHQDEEKEVEVEETNKQPRDSRGRFAKKQ